MGPSISKIKEQSAYTIIEGMMVMSILVVVMGAAFSLLDSTYDMNRYAQDGFEAQNQGRQTLSEVTKYLRPAENMSVPGVALLYAQDKGEFIDVKSDVNKDGSAEIIRIQLDRSAKQIKIYYDHADASAGEYNYQEASKTYFQQYRVPTDLSDWDSVEVIARRIVNKPPGGLPTTPWPAQTSATDGTTDFRLFTFYGDNFSAPLNTVAIGAIWPNYVRGVKIFLWTDIEPTKIPSPFGIHSNVHMRNISGE